MFAIKALFNDEIAVREGFSSIRKALLENHPDRADYYDVLRKILQQ
ncbi:hypothetical protein HF668_00605, partial [Acidithiobacillus ferridurans]|nr:hypothetical protein [Acidithiobacillus ferridurans]